MLDVTYKEILWIISLWILIYGNLVYLISIFKGKSHPHIYTWIIWTIILGIAFLWQISWDAWPWAWATLWALIASFLIVVLSLIYWKKDINFFDKILLIFCIIAMMLYVWIDNPLYSILLVTFIDLVAYIPTIRKTIKNPFSESLHFWWLMTFRMFLSILALNNLSFLSSFYLISIFFANIFMISLFVYLRKRSIK